jgi:hypothetical protein
LRHILWIKDCGIDGRHDEIIQLRTSLAAAIERERQATACFENEKATSAHLEELARIAVTEDMVVRAMGAAEGRTINFHQPWYVNVRATVKAMLEAALNNNASGQVEAIVSREVMNASLVEDDLVDLVRAALSFAASATQPSDTDPQGTKRLFLGPTPEMIEAGAQRLVRWETGEEKWPDAWSKMDVRAARNDAERCWLSMWLAAPSFVSETPAGGTAKVPERETRRVYKADAEEYRSYITARFEKANSGYRFRWLDREWRYEHSDFDERGDFDLLLAAAPSPDGNEEKG